MSMSGSGARKPEVGCDANPEILEIRESKGGKFDLAWSSHRRIFKKEKKIPSRSLKNAKIHENPKDDRDSVYPDQEFQRIF